MIRLTSLVLAASAALLLPDDGGGRGLHYPLQSSDGLELHNVRAEPATLDGKTGLRLTLSGAMRQRLVELEGLPPGERAQNLMPEEVDRLRRRLPPFEQLALVEGLEFSSGVIEVELAGEPEAEAPAGARGFVGVAFRLRGEDAYDAFYLRPTNARADDQERRNRSVQYVSHPEWPWQRLRQDSPGRYESYVDLVPGEWTKLRIEVRGTQARLFVRDEEQPTLVVDDLKSGADAKGAVALWIGPGTIAHFRNLTVER